MNKALNKLKKELDDLIFKPILDFLVSQAFKDFGAIFLCMLLYWGGSIVVIYTVINILLYTELWFVIPGIWFVSIMCMMFVLDSYGRGISYVHGERIPKRLFFTLLGPIGLLRYLSLLLFFKLRIDNKPLLKVNVRGWEPTSVWVSMLIEEAQKRAEEKDKRLDLAAKGVSLRKQFFQRAWKMATKRIEII